LCAASVALYPTSASGGKYNERLLASTLLITGQWTADLANMTDISCLPEADGSNIEPDLPHQNVWTTPFQNSLLEPLPHQSKLVTLRSQPTPVLITG